MIDLHTHALPFMDDGAKNIEDSIKMLSDAHFQGIKKCALTPHCTVHLNEDIDLFLKKRKKNFELLKEAIGENNGNIPQLILGAEIYAEHDISKYEDIGKLCYENSKYLLMELPLTKMYNWLSECVYSLGLSGIKVVIAHIDRYPEWEKVMLELDGLDVIYQINSSRFTTICNRLHIKKILKNDATFFVSSDMHNMTERKNTMQSAYKIMAKKDADFANKLFCENALKVVG